MLVDMRGIVIAWIGIVAIMFIGAFIYVWAQKNVQVDTNIVDAQRDIISVVDSAELTRKAFGESVDWIAARAAYDSGMAGLDNDLGKTDLERRIREKLPSGAYVVGSWGYTKLEVSGWDTQPCGSSGEIVTSTCFVVTGNKPFTLSDPAATITVNNSFSVSVNSSYFRLVSVAQKLAVDESNMIKDINATSGGSVTEIASALDALLASQYPDLTFSTTITGSTAQTTIEDRSCLPDKNYCLAPLTAAEKEQRGITVGGQKIPFDYLKIEISITIG